MRSRRHIDQRKKSAKSGDEKDNLFKKAQVFCEKAETICGNISQKQIAIKSEKCFEQENLPSAASNLKRTFTFIKESQEAEIASPNIVSSPKIPKKNLRSNSTNEDCSDLSSNRSNLLKSSIVARKCDDKFGMPLRSSSQAELLDYSEDLIPKNISNSQFSNDLPTVSQLLSEKKKPRLRRMSYAEKDNESQLQEPQNSDLLSIENVTNQSPIVKKEVENRSAR